MARCKPTHSSRTIARYGVAGLVHRYARESFLRLLDEIVVEGLL